jgi:molybdenum cofactor synthesis domain-containing protein
LIGVAVLTISDSVVAGTREDRSGAVVKARLEELGYQVALTDSVPDVRPMIAAKLTAIAGNAEIAAIFTTGGTGVALRDVTPEATRDVIDREIPGLGEVMRAEGRRTVATAPLSRATAGTLGSVLIVNLPGSPKGAVESLDAIVNLVPHMVDLLRGKTEHIS